MAISTPHGSPQFPVAATAIAPSPREWLDISVRTLQAQKDAWAAVPVRERIDLLDEMMRNTGAIAERWIAASLQAKRALGDGAAAEEWAAGPWPVLRNLRQLRRSLAGIEACGAPAIPGPIRLRPDGQVTAQIFPQTIYDRILFGGLTAETWMEPGVTRAEVAATQALAYHNKHHPGKVVLVLGAGNVSSIGPMDILYKLFVEDHVVLYKSNPVNAYLNPLLEEAFRGLVERRFLRIVSGGTDEGTYLCDHPGVEEIHITGSDKSFDAIVFGPGPEGAARKAAVHPLRTKPISGELGNVSPVIVVPGSWSTGDLKYQAEHLATMLTNNAGFNCNAARVIFQHAGWVQRDDLLKRIRSLLATIPLRAAYYPGASERQQAFVAAHPKAEQFGQAGTDELPWTLIPGVDPRATDDICFTTEAFCSLFAETAVEAASVPEYLDRSVELANKHLWGTLNATIIVHPRSLKDPSVAAAVERAIAGLRYGTVAVNYWAAAGYALAVTPWGAFPGHTFDDIQSGTGVVHNTLMFSRSQKSVLRAPFRTRPTPPWFVTRGRAGRKVFQRLCDLEAAPTLGKIPALIWAAMRG